ncbi:MAG TPA: polyprenyl synthetase family protein [Acidimicrobiales bacterium]|jgi:geranylgeranyl diphosphate synthase type I|nr:polyprenyl synthetase family protein [Acidimicrobiales bacterium]
MTPTIGVADVLARSRRAIHPAITTAIDRLAPEIRQIATYHMGWTDADGKPVDAPGGKGVRPTMAILGAEAAWADPDLGVPGGVAVELVHNFSLIHDDIIDTDVERHHRPTVWSKFGVGPAIVAGDALQVLAHQVLLEASPTTGAAASAALAEATASMIAGQADDIAFEKRRNVSVEQCTAMSAAKTGALLGCASSIGAILAGAPDATVGALRDYGCHLGLAFQAIDDLLGIWGDPDTTGKPSGSDLRQRKKSMPVVSALAAGGAEADELRTLILGPDDHDQPLDPLTAAEVDRARFLVEACGGREWTAVRAKSNLDAALGALERVRLSAIPHRDLADLAVYVVEREF